MLKLLRKRRNEALLLILLILIWTALIVGTTIIIHPQVYLNNILIATQFDSEIGWVPIPNRISIISTNQHITTNQQGFRSEEIDPSKRNILILGDSLIFGYGVDDDETISYYLEKTLKERHYDNVQVLNMGVPGYGIDQYYLFLKRYVNQTNPLLIILNLFAGNDIQDTIHDHAYGKSKPLYRWKNNKLQLANTPLSKNSCMSYLSSSWLFTHYDFLQHYLKTLCSSHQLEEEETNQVILGLLQEINTQAREHHIKLLYVISPRYGDFTRKSDDLIYFENVLSQNKLPHIDLYREINQQSLSPDLLYINPSKDGNHYTPLGNAFVAKVIYEHLNITKSTSRRR